MKPFLEHSIKQWPKFLLLTYDLNVKRKGPVKMEALLLRLNKFTKNTELFMTLGVLGVLCVMIVPVAPWALDLFIALTLAISVIILLVSIYSTKPLDFSTFPSILLMMTLFRLSLNIASTRNILLRGGDDGTNAAGQIIRSFGEFVVEGNNCWDHCFYYSRYH